jgi:F-type H+-transporting ATPase subunit c
MRALIFGLTLIALMASPELASAAEEGGASGAGGLIGIGSGLAIGLAVLGAGIGQGLTAGNAAGGVARNPGASGAIQIQMIIGLAFIESVALLAFVIAFMLQSKF